MHELRPDEQIAEREPPTASPLTAVVVMTILASVGTGVMWNGIFFIAEAHYRYTQVQSLWLSIVAGGVYVIGALGAGPLVRRLEQRLTPRTVLGSILALEALVCLSVLTSAHEAMLWFIACSMGALAAAQWPLIESYLSAGRGADEVRRAIGVWNVAWTASVAAAMIGLAPFVEQNAPLAIAGVGVLQGLGLVALPWLAPAPPAGADHATGGRVPREYPHLLKSSRVLLLLSYILVAGVSPLLPYRLDGLGVDVFLWRVTGQVTWEVSWKTPAAATWTVVRVIALVLMWRAGFWHGRWGTLVFGAAAMTAGFAAIVSAPTLPLMLAGFAVFGIGVGVVYYAALYYALRVGAAAVEAGGTHEALIGMGYALGPLLAMLGVMAAAASDVPERAGAAIVALVVLTMLLGAPLALRPYLTARRRR